MKIKIMIMMRRQIYFLFWITVITISWSFYWQSSTVSAQIIYRVDPLALLSATLRTYQKTGCDSELVTLSCPRGTSISIDVAQYGKPGNDIAIGTLCPPTTNNALLNAIHSGTEIEVKSPDSCLWPNALQYSLLQTVVEACQKKRHCKFIASPRTFGGDPCPGVRKVVEIAYKCRPYEFRSKVACENDIIQLICNPYSRIAVYSASYGRTEYESIQCSQPQGVKEETCLVSYATETVMQICHGKRKCNLSADSTTFGKPCRPDSRMYLKVVYTCVPRKVLKDRYESPAELDEPQQAEIDPDQDDLYDENQFYRESEAIPPAPKLQGGLSNPSDSPDTIQSSIVPPTRSKSDSNLEDVMSGSNATENEQKIMTIIGDWISAYIFLAQNHERFYLYVIISVTAGILLSVILVVGRIIVKKHRISIDKPLQTSNTGETTIPNGFTDDISEIDADIDLHGTIPLPSISMHDHQSYGIYNPSPVPYDNFSTTNLTQTSTGMPLPVKSSQQPSIIGTNSLLGPSIIVPNASQPINYLTGASHITTLRRQNLSQQIEQKQVPRTATLPRSLSQGGKENQQFYYG